jgi:dihydrofolate reductase
MAKLIYIVNASLDGYCEDPDGDIYFGAPDEEYFGFINDLERRVGTYLYGRGMYEAMTYWENAPVSDQPPWVVEFTNIWRGAEKIVFSKTLSSVATTSSTLRQEFDVEEIRQMKADASKDLTVGGADLAAQALGAGLVDECHLFFWPRSFGGGKPALPTQQHVDFALLDERCSRSGVVHLHYRVTQ